MNSVQAARPQINESTALRRLSRQRFWRRARRHRIELVWWPLYAAPYQLDGNGTPGPDASKIRRALALVDAHDASHVQFAPHDISETTLESFHLWPPKISPDEAARAAGAALARSVLNGALWRRPLQYGLLAPPRLLYWPLWAYYHQGALGILGCDLLDAVRGTRGGGKLRHAFFDALARAHRQPALHPAIPSQPPSS